MRYRSRPIWQWSVSLVTLKLGKYSLPGEDKPVNKSISARLKINVLAINTEVLTYRFVCEYQASDCVGHPVHPQRNRLHLVFATNVLL